MMIQHDSDSVVRSDSMDRLLLLAARTSSYLGPITLVKENDCSGKVACSVDKPFCRQGCLLYT